MSAIYICVQRFRIQFARFAALRLPGRHQHRTNQQYQERGTIVEFERHIVDGDFMCTELHVRRNGRKCAQHYYAAVAPMRLAALWPANNVDNDDTRINWRVTSDNSNTRAIY